MPSITPDDAVTAADLAEIRGQLREFNARHQAPQQVPSRPLHEICQDARRVNCGQCWQHPGLPCATHPETGDDGYHVARFNRAYRCGLISSEDLTAALGTAFASTSVIWDASRCPGCVGRGTGSRCYVCDGQIPPELRRQPGDPSEVRADCAGCVAGRAHVHDAPVQPGGAQ